MVVKLLDAQERVEVGVEVSCLTTAAYGGSVAAFLPCACAGWPLGVGPLAKSCGAVSQDQA